MLRSHILRGSGLAEGTITFTDSSSNASSINATSYTSSGLAIGDADANRQVYVSLAVATAATDTINLSSVTIGGVTATEVVGITPQFTENRGAFIYRANVTTGTTADVVVTNTTDNLQDVTIAVYSTLDFSTTPADTFETSSRTADITLSNLRDGSAVIAVMSSDANGQENNYTNLTVDYDDTVHDSTDTYVHYSATNVAGGNFTAASSDPSGFTYAAVAVAIMPV